MQTIQQLKMPQHLTKIKSSAYDIYTVNLQATNYFGYFVKPEYSSQPHLNSFLKLDMGIMHETKYLRKIKHQFNDQNEFFTFECPADYKLLSEVGQLEENVIIKILSDLTNALFALHQRGTLGRCFNVNNILLVSHSSALMMEFGFYPKIEYQVPEMIYNSNTSNYNEKIDIFLLGRVIYFLMVGKDIPTFTFNNLIIVSNEINVSIATTKYSEALKKLTIQMLSYDVNRRIDFLELISKFQKNPLYSQQQAFYKKPLSTTSIYKLIEQREKSGEVKDEDFGGFLVEMSCNIERLQKEQSQNMQPQLNMALSQKGPQIAASQLKQNSYNDDGNDFYPPDVTTSSGGFTQQHIVSNVTDHNTVILTQPSSQGKNLRSTLVQHDILLQVLPYLNADRPADCAIWNQIYFTQYRFSLLKKLTDQLLQYEKNIKQYMVPICIFALRKASIILKKEFQQQLDENTNLYEIEKKEWDQFVNQSEEYKRMKQKIRQEIDIAVASLCGTQYPLVKKVIDTAKTDSLMSELLTHTAGYLDDGLGYKNFEDMKKPYRYVLTNTLSIFDNVKDRQACQTRLLILMCILINRICDLGAVNSHFSTLAKFINIQQVTSIVDIELFLSKATENEYKSQFDELKQVYFS